MGETRARHPLAQRRGLRNGSKRVDMTRSPRHQRTPGFCALPPSAASSALGGNPLLQRTDQVRGKSACGRRTWRYRAGLNDWSSVGLGWMSMCFRLTPTACSQLEKRGGIFDCKSGGPFPPKATMARNFSAAALPRSPGSAGRRRLPFTRILVGQFFCRPPTGAPRSDFCAGHATPSRSFKTSARAYFVTVRGRPPCSRAARS
jgi:hypothetical protein